MEVNIQTPKQMEADEIAWQLPKQKGIFAAKLQQQSDEVNLMHQDDAQSRIQEALAFELTNHNIANLLQFRETVALGLENPTDEDRRRWLEILQTTVTLTGGIAIITCRLGIKVRKNLNES